MTIIKAVITTLDNLPFLQEQIRILSADSLISEIIVVNNGSRDGTREWLETQALNVIALHRENRGAGPGRNTGIDRAGEFDYVLLLDGGIRPIIGGVQKMLEFLDARTDVDVLGFDPTDTETNLDLATTEWLEPITSTYRNTRLSETAYCLARERAFDGLRFSEEGPFGEPGWGVDDDEMACQWFVAGIVVHVVCGGIHPYRRASGSFQRLFEETGIWPNQYGSVYEKRLVWCQQNWPQFSPGVQWGEPRLTVIVKVTDLSQTIRTIKYAHHRLRELTHAAPWEHVPIPYSVVAWCTAQDQLFLEWAEPRRLRQHHGDTVIVAGKIVRREPAVEDLWTGDFRIWQGEDPVDGVRPGSRYFGIVESIGQFELLFEDYKNKNAENVGAHCGTGVNLTPLNISGFASRTP